MIHALRLALAALLVALVVVLAERGPPSSCVWLPAGIAASRVG
jgi:hypothetical protein